jgi:hypothetical protein
MTAKTARTEAMKRTKPPEWTKRKRQPRNYLAVGSLLLCSALVCGALAWRAGRRARAASPRAIPSGDGPGAAAAATGPNQGARGLHKIPRFVTTSERSQPTADLTAGLAQLQRDCLGRASCDARQLAIEESALRLDAELGAAHPRREELLAALASSYDQRRELARRRATGELDTDQLAKNLEAHIAALVETFERLLTDGEYQRMFHVPKGVRSTQLSHLAAETADLVDGPAL